MRSGMMVGKDRPVSRFTWAKQSIQQVKSTKNGMGTVRYISKDSRHKEFEFTGVRTVEIQRSIGQDAATCTITIWNTHGTTSQPEGIDTAGRRGYLTPGRGDHIPAYTSVYSGINTDFGMTMDNQQLIFPTNWGYPNNMYRDVFIPNTVIRTYQGYGSDNFDIMGNEIYVHDPSSAGYVHPKDDTALYQTGTWLIDQVTVDAVADTITLECRDLAKLLIEQYIYPPLLPLERFPLIYCPAHKALGQHESIGGNVATYHSASTDAHYGYNGSVLGHYGSQAFDGNPGTFWLSGPNSVASDYEWIQARIAGPINEIVINCYGGNYIAYICVHENGSWQGVVPVSGNTENLTEGESPGGGAGGIYVVVPGDTLWDIAGRYYGDNFKWPIIAKANSNIIKDPHWIYPGQRLFIPYVSGTNLPPPTGWPGTGGTRVDINAVMSTTIPSSGVTTVQLPRTYDADFLRIVFTTLIPSFGAGSPFRCGVIDINARNHIPDTYVPSTIGIGGNITDWTEPIKEMCAWAGLTWENAYPNPYDPVIGEATDQLAIVQQRDALVQIQDAGHLTAAEETNIEARIAALNDQLDDTARAPMRAWGDFEILGAGPVVCTPGDYFMSKSFMDGIRLIVDFIGGIFFVDESGGAQFRLPNIWSAGNFIDDTDALSTLGARTSSHPIEFHEDVNLTSYSTVISDASVRSEILVVGGYPSATSSAAPVAGGYVLGYDSASGTTSAIDFTDVLAGQYRIMIVPGDATNLFYTETECQRMAELTALFILFTYRQGQANIIAHPGLQLDDQVRIFERSTYETNVHYVSGIDSKHDLEAGSYTMTCTVHWLGGDPNTEWFINKATLTPAVLQLPAVLARVGTQASDTGAAFEQPPYGT
jgi:LysM repeat protein